MQINSQSKSSSLIPFLSSSTNSPSSQDHPQLLPNSTKLKTIATKLITGVQPAPADVARKRWHSNHAHSSSSTSTTSSSTNPNPNHPQHLQISQNPSSFRPLSSDHSRSVTASAFAHAKQERAAQKNHPINQINNNNNNKIIQSIYHQRSHTQFDIVTPPNPPFLNQQVSPARSSKNSAPAVLNQNNTNHINGDHESIEDVTLLQLMQNVAQLHFKENEPPRDPRSKLLFDDDPKIEKAKRTNSTTEPFPKPHHATDSPSKLSRIDLTSRLSPCASPTRPSRPSRPHLPSKQTSCSSSAPSSNVNSNPIRELYLSQKGDQNGKVETEKERVDREFEKLLDTMQITDVVRIKMRGLDHPVKSAMLRSSTSANLIKLVNSHEFSHKNEPITAEDSKQEGSAWWAMYLKSHNFRELLAVDLKRLRVALRTQPPDWTAEFVGFGGYAALSKRLKELLEIEWREEQHDDQVLYEILRCFKALLLTDPGRKALGSRLPSPFIQLTGLLYSEKKPGDLAARQVLVELVQGCFSLEEYLIHRPLRASQLDWTASIPLESAVQPFNGALNNGIHHPSGTEQNDEIINTSHQLVRRFLMGPPDLKKAQIVEFVAVTHRVRAFKTFVNEFIGVLMDYFWVFCHAENQFWDLKTIDQEKIEAPKVPSGMTGGVEFEAMSYCTCLMKLVNQMIKTSGGRDQSKQIIQDLFESGFERCVATLRKSSMNYYPMVHLELSRFIDLGIQNGFEFPFSILKHLHGYQAQFL